MYSATDTLPEIDSFFADGLITEVLREVKSGKEATVYCCRAHPATDAALLAAKVYRSRQLRNFKNDAVYQQGRTVPGNRRADTRARRAVERKSGFGRDVQAASWTAYEYETLSMLYNAGADVPRPVASAPHALLMDYFGDAHDPAPLLHEVALEPDEARRLFSRLMRNVELLLSCNRIHGDLSAYNVLYWQGAATIIDVPQAVDPRINSSARELLGRDVANVYRYFSRHGVRADPARLADSLWRRFMRGEL